MIGEVENQSRKKEREKKRKRKGKADVSMVSKFITQLLGNVVKWNRYRLLDCPLALAEWSAVAQSTIDEDLLGGRKNNGGVGELAAFKLWWGKSIKG